MSQQPTPPPSPICRGYVLFFCIGVWCASKNVIKEKPEYVGDIQVKKTKSVLFTTAAYSLKPKYKNQPY